VSKNVWSNPVILISPYKSIPRILIDINLFEYLICKNKFDSYNKIYNSTCPIKIFHGKSDHLINISHSLELFKLIPNKLFKPTLFDNTGHNDILEKISLNEYNDIIELL